MGNQNGDKLNMLFTILNELRYADKNEKSLKLKMLLTDL